MNYKAVLFDLDGTLLDTIEDLADAMNTALAQLGCPVRTLAECRIFVGAGVDHFARQALGKDHQDDATVARCVELMRADYAKRWSAKTRPYDGIGEMLDGLTDRGLSLAVLSNKPDHFTKEMVGHFFGDEKFKPVMGHCDDVPLKPDPTSALQIACGMGVDPQQFLYMGDTDIDMQTANSAGMFAVGAAWGFRPREELADNGAQAIIDHPMQLLEFF